MMNGRQMHADAGTETGRVHGDRVGKKRPPGTARGLKARDQSWAYAACSLGTVRCQWFGPSRSSAHMYAQMTAGLGEFPPVRITIPTG